MQMHWIADNFNKVTNKITNYYKKCRAEHVKKEKKE